MPRSQAAAVLVAALAALTAGCRALPVTASGPADPAPPVAPPTTNTPSPPRSHPHSTPALRPSGRPPGPALLRPGSTGIEVRRLQARLKQLDWYSEVVDGRYGPVTTRGVRGFQAKRGLPMTGEVDQRTLDRLRARTRTPTRAELYTTVSTKGLDERCISGRAMCISKRSRSLVWVVDGQARMRLDVRFGSERTPTREGAFTVGWKSRNHFSREYSVPMPYAMFFSRGQAVHYSRYFARDGYAGASKGCVNLRDLAAAQTLFDQVEVGDKVIVYD